VQYRQGGHHSPGQHGRGASVAKCGALPPSPQTPESSAVLLHRVRLGQATDLHHRHCRAHRAPCVNCCRRHCLSDSWFELSRGDIEHGSHRGPYCSRRQANRIAGLAGASGPLVGSLGTSSSANGAGSSPELRRTGQSCHLYRMQVPLPFGCVSSCLCLGLARICWTGAATTTSEFRGCCWVLPARPVEALLRTTGWPRALGMEVGSV